MGIDKLVGWDVWAIDWVWLNTITCQTAQQRQFSTEQYTETKKAATIITFAAFFMILNRALKQRPPQTLFSDDFCFSTNGIKASHFVILNKVDSAATSVAYELDTTVS